MLKVNNTLEENYSLSTLATILFILIPQFCLLYFESQSWESHV